MKHFDIMSQMTLKQKANFVSGHDYWHLESLPNFDLPEIMITDGPHGLRKKRSDKKTSDGIGLGNSIPATCFPPAATSSCSWDTSLLFEQGAAIGEECLTEKVSLLLGPGTNIKRSPIGGRNFEYFSEDPYLSGKCSIAFINGVQSKGIGTSLKHFACNSQEKYRMIINEVVDERALREIYLPAFEAAVKEAKPWSIMNSYNRINGVYASQNELLLHKILRGEWGFDGLVVTDWGASVDRIEGLKCGTDLEMPYSGPFNCDKIVAAVQNGELDEKILDERVDRVIDLIIKSQPALAQAHTYDPVAHNKLAQKIAEASMQLLKNDDNILPIREGQTIAVIGDMAKNPRYQGAGSSLINPTMLFPPYDELKSLGVDFVFSRGYESGTSTINQALLDEAIESAKNVDIVMVFVGLPEELESEGYDRSNIGIPQSHNVLIDSITNVNPNIVVVLFGGSVICMPWKNKVKGILNAGLGGQACGIAIANILTGKVNPCGKTTETYPNCFEDNSTYGNFPSFPVTAEHIESIYVGYRYYDTANKDVAFPFGFGLSYTTFEYSNIRLSDNRITENDNVVVTFSIRNSGQIDGFEIAQLYVSDKESTIFRPTKELRNFSKVFIKAGEEVEVSLRLTKRDFAFYNVNISDWCVESGDFEILIGSSSRDIHLNATLYVESTTACSIPDYRQVAPNYYTNITNLTRADFSKIYGELPPRELDPNRKIDMNSCLNDARHTKWGGRLCTFLENRLTGNGDDSEGSGRMLAAMMTEIPIRNFVSMSCGAFSPAQAEGLLMILNDDQSSLLGFGRIFLRLGSTLLKIPSLIKAI